jgi:hypothetical protein
VYLGHNLNPTEPPSKNYNIPGSFPDSELRNSSDWERKTIEQTPATRVTVISFYSYPDPLAPGLRTRSLVCRCRLAVTGTVGLSARHAWSLALHWQARPASVLLFTGNLKLRVPHFESLTGTRAQVELEVTSHALEVWSRTSAALSLIPLSESWQHPDGRSYLAHC